MDFGFYLPCYWPDTSYPAQRMYKEMLEEAKFAEDLGFVAFAIPEHHFLNTLVHPSPLLTAVRVASVTKRIPIQTAVLVLPLHDMRMLAGEIAQADCLTDGRIQVGVGRGAFRYEFDRFGVPMEEARERFDDSLQLLIKLLSEENVSWDSRFYKFDALTITPRPVQKPHPPIWIAAMHEQSIGWAVSNGYPVMTTPLRDPFAAARMQADAFVKARTQAGPFAAGLRMSMLRNAYVGTDEADIREKVRFGLQKQRQFANVFNTPGEVDRGKIKLLDVPITEEEIANNIIIGSPQQCVDKLARYEALGIDNLMLNMNFGASHRDVMRSLELFATRVMPQFA
jgi:alkanesulfonate monooxygenase SsuD/methylene tetrahydromethanopterin reductase-like flavin-dependent oxidoreductase (luciferase family)